MTNKQLMRELNADLKYLGAKRRYLMEVLEITERMIANLSCRIVKLKEDKSK